MERAEELYQKIKTQGKSAIDEFIETRKAEELFLDFKRSANDGGGRTLHQTDRNNLSKAISGFGNSEGGVVIWGVDCSQDVDFADVAQAEIPIQNVKRFVSWLEGAISGCTIPPHSNVQNYAVEIDDNGNGFAITLIPKSNKAPHRDLVLQRYYIRAGSDFVPAHHDVLAGLFGKRPQPQFKGNYIIHPLRCNKNEGNVIAEIGFHCCNNGPGIANDIFVSVIQLSMGGPNCRCFFSHDHEKFSHHYSHGCFSIISNYNVRLPQGGWLEPLRMNIELKPPLTKRLRIEGVFGFGNAPPRSFVFENLAENVRSWYNRIFPILKTPAFNDEQREEIVSELLGIQGSDRFTVG